MYSVKRVWKKQGHLNRPMLVNFSSYHDKERLLYQTTNFLNGITIKDYPSDSSLKDIELVHDKFIDYALYVTKYCGNVINRAEVKRYPLKSKMWSQMIKYFQHLY